MIDVLEDDDFKFCVISYNNAHVSISQLNQIIPDYVEFLDVKFVIILKKNLLYTKDIIICYYREQRREVMPNSKGTLLEDF